ncbi:MAG: patatin-like phospholipase family protein [Rhodospirillales bacterium]
MSGELNGHKDSSGGDFSGASGAARTPRRVLSVDGGGLRGVMPAAFLAEIEQKSGEKIVDHFDLMAGTSTGAIIAIALGFGATAAEVLDFYKYKGPVAFSQPPGASWHSRLAGHFGRKARHWGASKYDPKPLRGVLEEIFGRRKLGRSRTRLLITAWDFEKHCPSIFKTAHHPRLKTGYLTDAVEAALSSTAAITYFPAHRLDGGGLMRDGGVWANNPTAAAALEAVSVLDWDARDVKILSLGCTSLGNIAHRDAGKIDMIKGGVEKFFLSIQSNSALSMTKVILGGGADGEQRLFRIDGALPGGFAHMDDPRNMSELEALGRAEARRHFDSVQKNFLTGPRLPFKPEYELGDEEIKSPHPE